MFVLEKKKRILYEKEKEKNLLFLCLCCCISRRKKKQQRTHIHRKVLGREKIKFLKFSYPDFCFGAKFVIQVVKFFFFSLFFFNIF